MSDTLSDYREKRDFGTTSEPEGDAGADPEDRDEPVFVVQEHDASSHHFDVRIEVDGVLRSWAVPKGPSTDPSDKRLAIPTEDHPLEYADWDGVIPEDEYGGGTVVVWDRGVYRNLKEDDDGSPVPVARQLEAGHATLWFEGEKIRGGYAFQRIETGDDERWLLVKMDDEGADARRKPTRTEPESVKTGRTLDEVAEEEEPESPAPGEEA